MSAEFAPHELEWTPERVGRLWAFYGSSPAYGGQYFSRHSGRAIVERAEREIGLRGKRVLDFGCGRGDLLAHLVGRGIFAAGLEFSAESAAEATARLEGEPLFGGVEVAGALPSSLAGGSFDAVFLVEVIEHLLDDQLGPTLAEVRRLLAPGGCVVVTAPNEEDLAANAVQCPQCGATFHRWQHQRSLSAASVAGLFAAYGFEPKVATGLDWGLTGRARLRRLLAHPRSRPGRPHLLYIGATPGAAR